MSSFLPRSLWPWAQVHFCSLELGSGVLGATSSVLEDSHVAIFS